MKITNEVLKEYIELVERLKEIEKRKSEIAEALKERGTFSTHEFSVIIKDVEQRRLAGLEQVTKVVDENILEKHGLIKQIVYQSVTVAPKKVA